MKKLILSFHIAFCIYCLLIMNSCAAAEAPAAGSGANMESADPTSESRNATTFTDVSADVWYAEAVSYCQQQGILNGISDNTFAPEETLTRAMLVTGCSFTYWFYIIRP